MTKLVNEISSELIARYKEKAKASADELEGKKQFRKATTRRMGIFRATGKQIEKTTANIRKALNKEEVEEIDEGILSKVASKLADATGITPQDVANSTIKAFNKKAPGTKMHNHPNFSKFKSDVHAHISSAKDAEEAIRRSSDSHVMSLAKKHFTEEVELDEDSYEDYLKKYSDSKEVKRKGRELMTRNEFIANQKHREYWKSLHKKDGVAVYKPIKEEVEEIDEISAMTHAKYRDAARNNIRQTMQEPLSPKAAEKIEKRVKGLSTSTALEYIKGKTKKGSDMAEAVHPMGLHVSMTNQKKNGLPAYKVHAVGKHISDQIKVGEHLTDTELDDAQEAGIKIRHIKEESGAKPLANILEMAKRGRPRKTEVRPAAKKSEDDEEDDYGPDVGPEADQNITVHLKKTLDNEKHETSFSDGKKHVVPQHVAHTVLHGMMKLKPEQRKQVQDHIQLSHKNLMDVHTILKGK